MLGSDAALINAIRSGDPGAYDVLRSRHGAAARRLASHLPHGPATVNDVVDWAFVQVLEAIRRGGGPTDAFRPYLLTAVQRAARDCAAGENSPIPTDDQDIPDPGQLMTAPAEDARRIADGGPAAVGGPAGNDRDTLTQLLAPVDTRLFDGAAREAFRAFAIKATPAFFLIHADGTVRGKGTSAAEALISSNRREPTENHA